MKLSQLLREVGTTEAQGASGDPDVQDLAYDSRLVTPGCAFVAIRGEKFDGAQYASLAVEKGAVAVVGECAAPPAFPVSWIQVPHARKALALMSREFFQRPDERVLCIAATGTNGKTTTTYISDAMLRYAGHRTALIGTIEYRVADQVLPALNTTPESLVIYRSLHQLLQGGPGGLSMEVSSHALHQGRVHGLQFEAAIFTNLTQDHLDYHGTMDAYFEAKQLLFQGPRPPRHAAINADDEWAKNLAIHAETKVLHYGLGATAAVRASSIQSSFAGLHFHVDSPFGAAHIHSPLVGEFNVYNLLAAYTVGLALGMPPEQAARGVGTLQAVPGRLERVDMGQPFLVLVDYAHTDDALAKALAVARTLTQSRVLSLFGCGGDRDRSKRPRMARAAAKHSEYVVLTSDNPRTEDPMQIIQDAAAGFVGTSTEHAIEVDRARAIALLLAQAQPGDVVVIAGKGHETYQEVNGVKRPFDDRETAREALRELGWRGA